MKLKEVIRYLIRSVVTAITEPVKGTLNMVVLLISIPVVATTLIGYPLILLTEVIRWGLEDAEDEEVFAPPSHGRLLQSSFLVLLASSLSGLIVLMAYGDLYTQERVNDAVDIFIFFNVASFVYYLACDSIFEIVFGRGQFSGASDITFKEWFHNRMLVIGNSIYSLFTLPVRVVHNLSYQTVSVETEDKYITASEAVNHSVIFWIVNLGLYLL